MRDSIKKKVNVPEVRIYIIYIFILSVALLYLKWKIGIIAMLAWVYLLYYDNNMRERRRAQWINHLELVAENIDWATKKAVKNAPMPLVIIEKDGSITWYNPKFSKMIGKGNILEDNIATYIPELDRDTIFSAESDGARQIEHDGRLYNATWEVAKENGTSKGLGAIALIYMEDITEKETLKQKYEQEQIAIVDIQVDNFDEVMANTEDTKRPAVLAQIDSKIGKWASALDASWRKYDKNKFIVIMQKGQLMQVEEGKFHILDVMREIDAGNQIPVTLSIGVGVDGSSPSKCNAYANSAIDLALGRGGDQAVVKRGEKLLFYGGKTHAVEKRSKVKSRVIANALRHLMHQSSEVFIMSHEVPDLDSMGAALGIYRCARHIGRNAYIIKGRNTTSVGYLIDKLSEKESYSDIFIDGTQVLEMVDRRSLLVVVDTHRPSFTEVPELVERADKVVVIDHHRRSAEAIESPVLSYLEPYASSASELVTEIVQYFGDQVELASLEADALLAGITMDTKSFTFKTGVRTFEAASYLRRRGANPTSIRQFLQDDMDDYVARADTVRSAIAIGPGIVMSQCPEGASNAPLIAAQAADTLLTIHGIHTSFVLSKRSDHILISGRSLGDINVQMVLEKLGGGGHLTIAGAQLKDIDIEEAKQRLQDALKEYLEEGE